MFSLDPHITEQIHAFFTVVLVDLTMAGDNAIIVGLAAAALPASLRRKAIILGIVAATVLRILFASVTMQLLQIIGLTLAGGILLLWVAWKMWREIRDRGATDRGEASLEKIGEHGHATSSAQSQLKFRQALWRIVVADVSMSLDNVLAVAGASKDHEWILVFGLVLSVVLMGAASTFIARMLSRHHWLAYVGLAIVAYIAIDMIYRGSFEVMAANGV